MRFPGADADTPLAMVRNGNSFTLETDVDTTFVGSGNLVQAGNYTVVIVEAGGNVGSATGTISVTGTALTQEERFVRAVYQAELGRPGSMAEIDMWASQVNGQASRSAIAGAIARSAEARGLLVMGWYQTYLGRFAGSGEVQAWVSMFSQGQTEEQVLSQILGSTEFFNRSQALITTGTPQAFYTLLLNRSGSAGEVANWVSILPQQTQQGVALAFLQSKEYRTDVFSDYYLTLLNRPADAAGLNGMVQSSVDFTTIRVGIEASDEFFANA